MTEALRGIGFDVTTRLDPGREAMRGVGGRQNMEVVRWSGRELFYRAWSGMQLAWQQLNFLLPLERREDARQYWRVLAEERPENAGPRALAAN